MCLIKEVWRDIPNYEGLYQISNYGYVRSLDRVSNCRNNNKQIRKGKIHSIPIVQSDIHYNFIREWESATQASKELNIDKSAIIKVCRGRKKTSGGYTWRYK